MNTEREALELAKKVLIEVVEADEQAIAELNHIGQTVAEPAVTAKCRHAIASILSAIEKKTEDGELVVFTKEHIAYVERFGSNCRDCADENGTCPSNGMPCADRDKVIQYVLKAIEYGINHKFIASPFTAPPSTAALQKRIEELEAREISLSAIERLKAVLSRAGYSTDESLETFAARLETHIYSLCQYAESKLDALKAGDVQAPKEGWIDYKVTSAGPVNDDVIVDVKFGDGTIRKGRAGDWNWQNNTLWRGNDIVAYRIAAAPTDKEGK